MYKDFFRLTEAPFSIAPNPRFLFLSERHREALAHLMYALEAEGGFVLLTGEVGTGKTTVCRCLLDQLPSNTDVALVLNPRLSAQEMLATVCDEFHLGYPAGNTSIKVFVDLLNAFLLEANAHGRKALLIIDEAQNLDPSVLEQLRLLTNLETHTSKLLRIILLGQPELLELLSHPSLRQVEQRVVARYHLTHLSKPEASAYVAHRLQVAGAQPGLIPEKLIAPLYRATGGVPRLINVVCDRALLGTYVEGKHQVTAPILKNAASEVLGTQRVRRSPWRVAGVAALGLSLAAGAGLALMPEWRPALKLPNLLTTSPAPAAVAAAATRAPLPSAPAEPAKPASQSLEQALVWPDNAPLDQAETLAYRALMAAFGGRYTPVGDTPPCQLAESFGLRCLTGRGDLTTHLRAFNQPALLHWQAGSLRYPVVLEQIQGEQAVIAVGGERRPVRLADLASAWAGEYVVFWRPPPGYQQPVGRHTKGAVVVWLRDALATVLKIPRAPGGEAFDDALAEQLQRFQSQEGIKQDGLAGPLTLIRLNQRIDPNTTRLERPVGGA